MTETNNIKSDLDYLTEHPSNWELDRIKDKTTSITGGDWGNDPDSDAEGLNIVVLRVADMNNGSFNYENLTLRRISENSFKNRRINDRSLIIEKSGGGEKQIVGRVSCPKNLNTTAICSNFMAKIDFDKKVDINYMNYLFFSLYNSKVNFQFIQQTTGIQNLNVGYYLNTKVAFPPPSEQKAIADYLDNVTAKIDRVIEIKERQLEKMNLYYNSRIKEAIRYGVSGENLVEVAWMWTKKIPQNWQHKRLKDFFKLSRGVDLPKDKMVDGEYPVYGSNGEIGFHNEYTTKGPGITIGRSGSVGAIKYVNVDYWAHNTCLYVYQNNGNSWRYLYYFLLGVDLSSLSGGSVVGTLNRNYIHKEDVAMPDLAEQIKIVNALDILKGEMNKLLEVTKEQISRLNIYRRSIIHEYVTGKKRVREGEIEN